MAKPHCSNFRVATGVKTFLKKFTVCFGILAFITSLRPTLAFSVLPTGRLYHETLRKRSDTSLYPVWLPWLLFFPSTTSTVPI